MDEPTSSLDEHEVTVLFDVIRQLKREGAQHRFRGKNEDTLRALSKSRRNLKFPANARSQGKSMEVTISAPIHGREHTESPA